MPGFYRIPRPLPPAFTMEDRDDGTIWLLTHRREDERWAITDDPIPGNLRGFVSHYAAFLGPVVGENPTVRLLIRGGRMGYEVDPLEGAVRDRDQAQVTTRRGRARFSLGIDIDGWTKEGDTLGYNVIVDT